MPEDAPSYTALAPGSNEDDLQAATSNEAPDDEQSDESTVSDQESNKQQRRYYWTMALLNLLDLHLHLFHLCLNLLVPAVPECSLHFPHHQS